LIKAVITLIDHNPLFNNERNRAEAICLPFTPTFSCPGWCLQCLDAMYGGNGKRQRTPERNAIGHTHGNASSRAKA
jgi:hypothetical protein